MTFKDIITAIVIIILTWYIRGEYFPNNVYTHDVDTVFVDVPYEIKVTEEVEVPIYITQYDTVEVTVERIVHNVDTVTVYIDTGEQFHYSTRFLSNYPEAPKFLGFESNKRELNITYLMTNGITRTKHWNQNSYYRIGLNNGEPTMETFKQLTFDRNVGFGYIHYFGDHSPYIEATGSIHYGRFTGKTTVNVNKHPFISIGVEL